MSSYVTLAQFKDYARNEITASDDTVLQLALDSAEMLINNFCGRTFYVAGAASARSYSPATRGAKVLPIHDCTSVTSIVEMNLTLDTSTYQLEPLNGITPAGDSRPYDRIRRYGSVWFWDDSKARIVVTATWGWASTPYRVQEATYIVAKDIYQQRNTNAGVAGFGEFGAVRVRMNPIAIDLLTPLRRAEAIGIA
jgi:hypothetical protein